MNDAIVPAQLVAAIHDYLLTRPMREVEGLVNGLRNVRPLPSPASDEGNTASDRAAERKDA